MTTSGGRAPRPRIERDRPRLTGRAAVLLLAVSILALMAMVPVNRFLDQRSMIADLERMAARLESENADLRAAISKLRDPAELERLARDCLGMVGAGEIVFVTPGKALDPADC